MGVAALTVALSLLWSPVNAQVYFYAPTRRLGCDGDFDVRSISALPPVELVFSYPGSLGHTPRPGTRGVVVATTSGFTAAEREHYATLRRAGVVSRSRRAYGRQHQRSLRPAAPPKNSLTQTAYRCPQVVVATFPSGEHVARPWHLPADSKTPPVVAAVHLKPEKVRILLMLALTKTVEPSELQALFDVY
eukprot:SAG11_NODE_3439_length_2447_cov_4.018313_1_plen_190_part_00